MRGGALALALAIASGGWGSADAQTRPLPRNLYGNTGLIELPSGHMQPDGEIGFTLSHVADATRASVTFQALPRVEGTFRYTSIEGFPANGQPNLYDRAFDLKIGLLTEDALRPAVALGFRDILGTGIYASEYVAVSKSITPDLRATAGVGWGRLGSFGGVGEPFGGGRSATPTTDGDVRLRDYFSGDAAFFGGIEWDTPIKGLTVAAEYSSDAYLPERGAGLIERKSPFNFGLKYNVAPGVTLGAHYLYGSEVAANLSFSINPARPGIYDEDTPAPFPLGQRKTDLSKLSKAEKEAWASDAEDIDFVMNRLRKGAAEEKLIVEGASLSPYRAEVRMVNPHYVTDAQAIGRMARVMSRAMPATVETFDITVVKSGVPTTTATISRTTLGEPGRQPRRRRRDPGRGRARCGTRWRVHRRCALPCVHLGDRADARLLAGQPGGVRPA